MKSTAFIYPVDVGAQYNLPRIDLLYSNSASGMDNSAETVNLDFKHMLSRLKITLIVGPNAPGGPTDYNFIINGFSATANFSLIDGSFSNYGAPTYLFANPIPDDKTPLTLFLLPSIEGQTANRYIQFNYYDETSTYSVTWHIPTGVLFEGGKSYSYTLTINGPATRSVGSGLPTVEAQLISIQ